MSNLTKALLEAEISTKLASGIKMPAVDLRSVQTDIIDSVPHLTANTDAGTGVKFTKITGTSASAEGGTVEIVTGIIGTILGIDCVINAAPPNHTVNPALEYGILNYGNTLFIKNATGNSSSLLSQPITLFIRHEG